MLRATRLALIRTVRLNSNKTAVEPKFSKSAAFQGRGKPLQKASFNFDYYSTDEWAHKKIFSALASLTAIIIYFGWLREPSDLDEIWAAPPHILTANLERKMLRDQINEAKIKGLSTELLQAQLDYVDVKEAALRVQFEQRQKK